MMTKIKTRHHHYTFTLTPGCRCPGAESFFRPEQAYHFLRKALNTSVNGVNICTLYTHCNGLLGAGHERMLADLSRMLHQGSVSVIKTPRNGRKSSGGNGTGAKDPADTDLRYNAMGWSVEPGPAGKYLFKRGSLADGSRHLENDVPEVKINHDGSERTSRLGIQYLYVNGTPVIGARFTVYNQSTGQKIRQGFIRPDMVTWVTLPAYHKRVTVRLHDDPYIKRYLKHPVPNPEKRKADAWPGWFDRMTKKLIAAGDWTVELLKGDFNQDPTLAQIITNTIITMIPLVDQVADIRDIAAGIKVLAWDRKYKDYTVWIGICFTLIGLFPTVGSLAKGVLKSVFKSVPLAQIAKVFNGLAEGNVVRYLKMLEDGGLDTMHRQTLDLFNKLITTVRARLTRIKALVPDRLKDSHAALDRLNDGLNQAIRNAPDMMVRFFDDLLQKIKAIFTGPRLENAMSGPTNSTLIRKQARADAPRLEMSGSARTRPDNSAELKTNPKRNLKKEYADIMDTDDVKSIKKNLSKKGVKFSKKEKDNLKNILDDPDFQEMAPGADFEKAKQRIDKMNDDFSPEEMKEIKKYMFDNKEWSGYDPNNSTAWKNLQQGKITEVEETLLKHERVELLFRRKLKDCGIELDYTDAHFEAESLYNFTKVAEKAPDFPFIHP